MYGKLWFLSMDVYLIIMVLVTWYISVIITVVIHRSMQLYEVCLEYLEKSIFIVRGPL